jgi:protease IV
MLPARFAPVARWLAKFWRLLDSTRHVVLNLLFLAVVVALVIVVAKRGPPALEEGTALVLDIKGTIVEQRATGLRNIAFAHATAQQAQDTQLRDVLAVLDAAAKDPKIVRVVLMLDDLQDAGLPVLREIAAALERFKAGGKSVVAWGSEYNQRQYYLAAHANEVLLDPFGLVFMDGYGRYRNYYRDALDKLGIKVNLLRVGKYKSFGEPYILNAPSDAAREAEGYLYNALWATYTEDVEKARKTPPGTVMAYIDEMPGRLVAAGSDPAKMALDSKLVDGLKTRDQLRQLMIERGAKDKEGKTFRQVSLEGYLAHLKPATGGDAVGVIVAEGEIIDGKAQPGTVGGLSTSELVRKAREDEKIKAIVLRVNSPGGSAFGSELVRRELELARAAGKPVVISMGNVAASGGYWISMSSDEVMADPATITGSIGVFGLLPTADKALDKIGVHTAGVTTTWLGGAADPRLPFNPRLGDLMQMGINHVYTEFTTKAAQARKTTPEKIDEVGQGRVWSGAQAKERGLVDSLGGYTEALKSAAKRGKLGDEKGEGFRVAYIQSEPSLLQRVLEMFSGAAARILAEHFDLTLVPEGVPAKAAQEMVNDVGWLANFAEEGKPFTAIVHCLCRAP